MLTHVVTGETISFLSMKKVGEFLGISTPSVRSYLDKNLPYKDYIISQPDIEESKENILSSKPQTIILTKVSDDSSTLSEEFPTIGKAAEYLGISRSTLNGLLNKPSSASTEENLCIINGFIVTKSDKTLSYIKSNNKVLEITDLVNNTTVTYPSVTSAALGLGVGKGSISMHLKGKQSSPPHFFYKKKNGGYVIKLTS